MVNRVLKGHFLKAYVNELNKRKSGMRKKRRTRKGFLPFLLPLLGSIATGYATNALGGAFNAATRRSGYNRKLGYNRKKGTIRRRRKRRGDLDADFLDNFGNIADDIITPPRQRKKTIWNTIASGVGSLFGKKASKKVIDQATKAGIDYAANKLLNRKQTVFTGGPRTVTVPVNSSGPVFRNYIARYRT